MAIYDTNNNLLMSWYILLTAIGLTHGGSSTVHIYIRTIYGKTRMKTEYTEQNIQNNNYT